MTFLRPLFRLCDLIIAETSPIQISSGAVLGMLLGFTPAGTLHWVLGVLCLFVLRVNLGVVFLSFVSFEIFSYAFDPLFHLLGFWVLTEIPGLQRAWAWMFHAAILPFTRFNNTVVMGSFIFTAIFAVPLFIFSQKAATKHRQAIVAKIKDTPVWRSWSLTRLYRLYVQYLTQSA